MWQQLCNLPPPVFRNGARELDVKVDDHIPLLARLLGDWHTLQEAATGVADHSLHGVPGCMKWGMCCTHHQFQAAPAAWGGRKEQVASVQAAPGIGLYALQDAGQPLERPSLDAAGLEMPSMVAPAPQCATATAVAAPRDGSAT